MSLTFFTNNVVDENNALPNWVADTAALTLHQSLSKYGQGKVKSARIFTMSFEIRSIPSNMLPQINKRTARACEHCRQARRRCAPPYPCPACSSAGLVCEVRAEARPKRRKQSQAQIVSLSPAIAVDRRTNESCKSNIVWTQQVQEEAAQSVEDSETKLLGVSFDDAYEVLKAQLQDILLAKCGMLV
jgi:hypothetical protein